MPCREPWHAVAPWVFIPKTAIRTPHLRRLSHRRLNVTLRQVTWNHPKEVALAIARSPLEKVHRHRDKLRPQGLRSVQIWVPDTRSPAFAAEARCQSAAVALSEHASDDQAFVDAISAE